MKTGTKTKILLQILLILYILFMLWLLFGQRMGFVVFDDYTEQLKRNINIIPFKTAAMYFKQIFVQNTGISPAHAVINFFGNIIMFIPLGFFLPLCLTKKLSFGRFICYIVIIIFSVEIIQFVTLLGSFDVDDIILNTLGSSVGYPFHKLIKKYRV